MGTRMFLLDSGLLLQKQMSVIDFNLICAWEKPVKPIQPPYFNTQWMRRRGLCVQTSNIQTICSSSVTSLWRDCRSPAGMVLPSSPLFVGVLEAVVHSPPTLITQQIQQSYLLKACYKRHVDPGAWYGCPSHCSRKQPLWFSPFQGRSYEGLSLFWLCSALTALHRGNSGRWESAGMVILPFLAHQPSPTLFCYSHSLLLLTPFSFFPALLWVKQIVQCSLSMMCSLALGHRGTQVQLSCRAGFSLQAVNQFSLFQRENHNSCIFLLYVMEQMQSFKVKRVGNGGSNQESQSLVLLLQYAVII